MGWFGQKSSASTGTPPSKQQQQQQKQQQQTAAPARQESLPPTPEAIVPERAARPNSGLISSRSRNTPTNSTNNTSLATTNNTSNRSLEQYRPPVEPPATAPRRSTPPPASEPEVVDQTETEVQPQQQQLQQVQRQPQAPPAQMAKGSDKKGPSKDESESAFDDNMKAEASGEHYDDSAVGPKSFSYDNRTYDEDSHTQAQRANNQNHLNSLFNGHLMKWKFEAEEGTIFLRLPAFMGALAQIGVAIAAFVLNRPDSIETHSIVMYTCIITMSILILILDGRFLSSHPLSIRSHLRNIASRNFNILRFLWGRGLLYTCVGVLNIAQMWVPTIIAGTFLCFVGILSVIVGVHASRKFAALRNSLADESFLLLVFANYDADADGYIDPSEFSWLLVDLGVELDDRYTLKAFNSIDKDGDRLISFEEFSHWWSSGFVERGRKTVLVDDDDSYRRMEERA